MNGIVGLQNYYIQYYSDFYSNNHDLIQSAITELQDIYSQTVFIDQKVDWTTHPNNLGHIDSAGCFRCHDGKHLNSQQQAIRLECNLCHSIPVVVTSKDFVARIEINRGPEPQSHLNPNWISLHHNALDATCSNCHTITDAGGTSNTSFCSNSACHGSTFQVRWFRCAFHALHSAVPTAHTHTDAYTGSGGGQSHVCCQYPAHICCLHGLS